MNSLLVAGISPPYHFSLQGTNRWAVHTFLERAVNMSLWLHTTCFRSKYNIRKGKEGAQGNWASYLGTCRAHLLCLWGGSSSSQGSSQTSELRFSGHTAWCMPDGTPQWQGCGSPGHRKPLGGCHCSHITA